MGKLAFQLLLCVAGLQAAPRPPAPTDLLVIVTLGTPCLPAAHARISLPALGRWTVADSLGQGTIPSVPAGDLRIAITHFGTAALRGTVRIAPGGGQVMVLADLRSHELRIVSIRASDARGSARDFGVQRRSPAHRESGSHEQ